MSAYIRIATGEYFFYESDIRLAHPGIGVEFVCPPEYALVKRVPPPTFDDMVEQLVAEPKFADGEWIIQYQVIPLPERVAAERKKQREALLGIHKTDLTVSGSAPDVIE